MLQSITLFISCVIDKQLCNIWICKLIHQLHSTVFCIFTLLLATYKTNAAIPYCNESSQPGYVTLDSHGGACL